MAIILMSFAALILLPLTALSTLLPTITTGPSLTCLLRSGRVLCWGDGRSGATANPDLADLGAKVGDMASLAPISFASESLIVKDIVAGQGTHTCALFTNLRVLFFFIRSKEYILKK
jgi:hypothetical protein